MKYQRYEYSLLELIEHVHGATTGAYAFPTIEEEQAAVTELRKRYDEWQPSKGWSTYDEAVLGLLAVAIVERAPAAQITYRK